MSTMDTERRLGTAALTMLWVVAAALAVAVGFGAVRMVGAEVSDQAPAPLSTQDVGAQVRSVTPSPAVSGSRTPGPRPTRTGSAGSSRTVSLAGGTVAIRCTGTSAALLYATPADGYASEVKHRGPDKVEVEFDGDRGRSRVEARCSGGNVQLETR
jgi:hypothetical protein